MARRCGWRDACLLLNAEVPGTCSAVCSECPSESAVFFGARPSGLNLEMEWMLRRLWGDVGARHQQILGCHVRCLRRACATKPRPLRHPLAIVYLPAAHRVHTDQMPPTRDRASQASSRPSPRGSRARKGQAGRVQGVASWRRGGAGGGVLRAVWEPPGRLERPLRARDDDCERGSTPPLVPHIRWSSSNADVSLQGPRSTAPHPISRLPCAAPVVCCRVLPDTCHRYPHHACGGCTVGGGGQGRAGVATRHSLEEAGAEEAWREAWRWLLARDTRRG
ncbi:hypothetical protein T484DRAFT_2927707 [Baffinella frigidus]|nr:hypothetical protein T484DRAFT_2927707 [Cryptophyta sp. CCMP2293]